MGTFTVFLVHIHNVFGNAVVAHKHVARPALVFTAHALYDVGRVGEGPLLERECSEMGGLQKGRVLGWGRRRGR